MTYDDMDYSGLPTGLQDGMKKYIEQKLRAGGFLTACLENDLVGAFTRADATNLKRLQEIVRWLYNEAPAYCWGSKEKVAKWLGQRTVGEINKEIKDSMQKIVNHSNRTRRFA